MLFLVGLQATYAVLWLYRSKTNSDCLKALAGSPIYMCIWVFVCFTKWSTYKRNVLCRIDTFSDIKAQKIVLIVESSCRHFVHKA